MSLPAEGEGQPHQPEQRPCPPCHPCRYDPGFPPLSTLVPFLSTFVVIVIWDQPIIIFVLSWIILHSITATFHLLNLRSQYLDGP